MVMESLKFFFKHSKANPFSCNCFPQIANLSLCCSYHACSSPALLQVMSLLGSPLLYALGLNSSSDDSKAELRPNYSHFAPKKKKFNESCGKVQASLCNDMAHSFLYVWDKQNHARQTNVSMDFYYLIFVGN